MKMLLKLTLTLLIGIILFASYDAFALEDTRHIEFSDTSYFHVSKHGEKSASAKPLTIQGENGSASFFDSTAKEWKTIPLEGVMPQEVLFIQTDEMAAIVGPVIAYIPRESGTLKDTGNRGSVTVTNDNSSYTLEFNIPYLGEHEYHLWYIVCDQTVFEWDDHNKAIWERINFSLNHRICYDGAYYTSPISYSPYEEDMYYRCPAVHPLVVFLEETSPIMRNLAYAFMDIALEFQNEEGYWPTAPESLWLSTDYGIGSGFYDTRFNCDITEHLLKAYEVFSEKKFLEAALRQADWLVELSYKNSMLFGYGYFISDYYSEDMETQPHASLNHTLQEIKVLLRAVKLTGERKYQSAANRLLNGIRATERRWYNPQKGLEYGIMPDGTMGFNDYPYLTYNDLFDVQELLEARSRRDPALDRLMEAKLKHMLDNGITEYKTKR